MLPNQLTPESFSVSAGGQAHGHRPDRFVAAPAAWVRFSVIARADCLRLEVSRREARSRSPVRLSRISFAGAPGTGHGGLLAAPADPRSRKDRLGQRAGHLHRAVDGAPLVDASDRCLPRGRGGLHAKPPPNRQSNRRLRTVWESRSSGRASRVISTACSGNCARTECISRGVKPAGGLRAVVGAVARRAAAHPLRYGHWYIDGGAPARRDSRWRCRSFVCGAVALSRRPAGQDAEDLRSQRLRSGGLSNPHGTNAARRDRLECRGDAVLTRFQLSLLTEGSGTQVFATTFVQWAARETCAAPSRSLCLARFAPRQRENPMNGLLAGGAAKAGTGSPRLPDRRRYGRLLHWLNQQRLSGAERATFLAWFEDQTEAVAIGSRIRSGSTVG